MTCRFRPVWFILDPFTGARSVMGMLVQDGSGIEFVAAPDATRGLLPKQQNVVELVTQLLSRATNFDELPIGAGPQVILGDPSTVPATVDAPARWVAERVLQPPKAA